MDSTKCLFKFEWDCGRMGSLSGAFIATRQEVADAIGEHIYFGEVLGKHSDIEGVLEEKDLQEVTDDPKMVELFETHLNGGFGHNPLNYLPEDEDEDDYDNEEDEDDDE